MGRGVSKKISVFLIIILLIQLLPMNIFAEEKKKKFIDVVMYEDEINQLVELGIIKGYPDNTFRPNQPITRLQAVTMIIREMGLKTTGHPDPHFKDVKPGMYGYDIIATAADEGIISGKSDGTFDPAGLLTRAQMAKILVNAYKLKSDNLKEFKDVNPKHWAYQYIGILAANGITTGYSDGTFKPENYLTRAHFAVFLSRYINEIKNKKQEPKEDDESEKADIEKKIALKADRTNVYYIEPVTLTLEINDNDISDFTANWKTTGGTLSVTQDGKSAQWKATENADKEYTITATVEVKTKSGKTVTVEKNISISTLALDGGATPTNPTTPNPQEDSDKDGLTNSEETTLGTDPSKVDTDGDGLKDGDEVKTYKTNPLKIDTDNNGVIDGKEDFDKDGLENWIESGISTDPFKEDTDGDRLSDGYELKFKPDQLNPTKADTDDNGKLDSDEDFDKDGLTNIQEQEVGTDPFVADTDGESLSDGQEVNNYHTNPTLTDTDEDGLDDDSEIKFGTDPLKADTDGNGVVDGEEKRQQEIKSEDLGVTISFNATGDAEKTTTVQSNEQVKDYVGTNGMIGVPVEINTSSDFDQAELTFSFDPNKLGSTNPEDLSIFYFNPETFSLEKVESRVDLKNNQVTATVSHFSTYVLADSRIWAETWKSNLVRGNTNPDGSVERKPLELVFVIDSSGSMRDNDSHNYRISGAKLVIDSLTEKDRAAIVHFSDDAGLLQGLTNGDDKGKQELKDAVELVDSFGGTNIASGLQVAIDHLREYGSKDGSTNQVIILLTDGENNFPYQDDDTRKYAQQAKDLGIKVYTMGLGDSINADLLKEVAELTGGDFYHVNSAEDLHGRFLQAGDRVGLTKDTDGDTIPDWVEEKGYIIKDTLGLESEPTNPNLKDSDGDGLEDSKELGDWYYDTETGKVYVTLRNSDPNSKDSDGDGDNDNVDDRPKVEFKPAVILIHGINSDTGSAFGLDTYVDNAPQNVKYHVLLTEVEDNQGIAKKDYHLSNKNKKGIEGVLVGYSDLTKGQLLDYDDPRAQFIRNNPTIDIGGFLNNKDYKVNRDLFVFNWENNGHIYTAANDLYKYLQKLTELIKENQESLLMDDTTNEDGKQIVHFNLIGHSAGGLVSRYVIENLIPSTNDNSFNIDKLITISTPHFGSNYMNNPGVLARPDLHPMPVPPYVYTTYKIVNNVLADLDCDDSYLFYDNDKNHKPFTLDKPKNTDYYYIAGFRIKGPKTSEIIEMDLDEIYSKNIYVEAPLVDLVAQVKRTLEDRGVKYDWHYPEHDGDYEVSEELEHWGAEHLSDPLGYYRYGDGIVSLSSQLGLPGYNQTKDNKLYSMLSKENSSGYKFKYVDYDVYFDDTHTANLKLIRPKKSFVFVSPENDGFDDAYHTNIEHNADIFDLVYRLITEK